jgi:hypothetical protein
MATSIDERKREQLAQTDRHIANCKTILARQRELLRGLVERDQPTQSTEDTLNVVDATLRTLERHRQIILDGLRRAE